MVTKEKSKALFKECKRILADEELLVPRAQLRFTNQMLSFTDSPRSIHIGRVVRCRGEQHVIHSMLHELLHILVYRVTPNKTVKKVFGAPESWEGKQRFFRWCFSNPSFISRYAQTHPEEDLVETAAFLLDGSVGVDEVNDLEPELATKIEAVEQWFEQIRKRRTSRN